MRSSASSCGFLDGQAAQAHRVDQLEDCGVRADAQRKGEDRHRGEGAALGESAHRVARIAKEAVEAGGGVLGVDSLAHDGGIAESQASFACRFCGAHALGEVVVDAHLQVLAKLVLRSRC